MNYFQNIENDTKAKNVRLTELVIDLRDAVLHICRYFIECDESFKGIVNLQVYIHFNLLFCNFSLSYHKFAQTSTKLLHNFI